MIQTNKLKNRDGKTVQNKKQKITATKNPPGPKYMLSIRKHLKM